MLLDYLLIYVMIFVLIDMMINFSLFILLFIVFRFSAGSMLLDYSVIFVMIFVMMIDFALAVSTTFGNVKGYEIETVVLRAIGINKFNIIRLLIEEMYSYKIKM
jgi:hypothetical protein